MYLALNVMEPTDLRVIVVHVRYPFANNVRMCGQHDPIGCFGCTREKGHEGPHVAYGVDDRPPYAIWETEDLT